MPSFAAVLAANAANAPKAIRPVAVIVGGTAGVGASIAQVLAERTHGRSHIVLIGRNEAAANDIIAKLPKAVDGGRYEFVQCDVSSMRNVGEATKQLSERLDKINYLVMTAGILSMAGRRPTEDGVDFKLALHYYSRFKFARDLAGLVESAAEKGEPARVMSVYDSKRGGPIFLDDMALEKNYSLSNAANVGITYNNAALVELAKRHPTVSFIHAYPGIVKTNITSGLPLAVRLGLNLVSPFIGVKPIDCAENMVYSLFEPTVGKPGAYFRDDVGNEVPRSSYLTPEVLQKVWQHSIQVTDPRRDSA
ncbi:NAD(P)-binding protein [Auriculariales sp. MPI-PUGE-AT-0066]|nr:NAD(P)-binding protein [Auriculariales sp. MPI-PUGE-AT-0066]